MREDGGRVDPEPEEEAGLVPLISLSLTNICVVYMYMSLLSSDT